MSDNLTQRAIARIESCEDPTELCKMAENAARLGEHKVRRAAQLRLYSILPAAKPGTLEHDVWQSIYALEGALKEERGKTVLLSRTRQKIKRDGEKKTVADLVLGKVSEGFRMLLERDMPELTFEAVALRHVGDFDDESVISAAEERLREEGCDPSKLIVVSN